MKSLSYGIDLFVWYFPQVGKIDLAHIYKGP